LPRPHDNPILVMSKTGYRDREGSTEDGITRNVPIGRNVLPERPVVKRLNAEIPIFAS
jgi:hypothetical protein